MTLGERLRAYREKEGLTQEQLAEYLNVSRQAVTKWEHDKGVPDIDNLVAISRRMGVTLDELVLGQAEERAAFPSPAAALSPDAPFSPAKSRAAIAPDSPAASQFSAGPETEKCVPVNSSFALSGAPAPPATERRVPSERARHHAFAALAFVFVSVCWVISGCVNLAAAFHRAVPAFLPVLNFCSAVLALFAAYAQAVACSRHR